jgi:ketosteroid isomerase-like protein
MSAGTEIELVRTAYEGYARGDFSTSLSFLDPSMALVVDDDIPDGGNFFGLAGVREYMSRFLEPWEKLTITPEWIEQVDNAVIARLRQDAVGRGSGATATMHYFHVWTFRGERVVHLEVIVSEERARAAAGLVQRIRNPHRSWASVTPPASDWANCRTRGPGTPPADP